MNDVFGIGDSIMLSVTDNLQKLGCNINIDAEVGRQFHEAIPIMKKWPLAPSKLVVHLGTNGYIHEEDLDFVVNFMKDGMLWLTTIYVPRPWMKPNNKLLRHIRLTNENIKLVPWRYQASKHPEWFGEDGYHPNPIGQRAYAKILCNRLEL